MKKTSLFLPLILTLGLLSGCNQKSTPIYHMVTFDSDGGTEVASQSVLHGASASEPTDPSKTETSQYVYTFSEWTLDGQTYDFSSPVTSDITLKAEYDVTEKWTVRFDSDGGTPVDSQVILNGNQVSKPADPTKASTDECIYTFDNWYLNGEVYDFSKPVTSSFTLTAGWNKTMKWTVTFDSNGGSDVASQTVLDGKTATKPADPVREFTETVVYTFEAWYLGDNVYDFATPVTGNITLTAHWTSKAILKVHFDNGQGQTSDENVISGEMVTRPMDPVYTDGDGQHTFLGWYKDDTLYDFSTPVTEEITLVARYSTENFYASSYDAETGSYTLNKATKDGSNYTDSPFIDFGAGFDDGGIVTVEFHGKFKPQVAMLSAYGSKTMTASAVNGVVFSDDAIGSDYRVWPNSNTISGAVLANKADWTKMAYNNLDKDTDYRMTLQVSYQEGDANFYLGCELYALSPEGDVLITSNITTYNLSSGFSVSGSHIILYGSRVTSLSFKVEMEKSNSHSAMYLKQSQSYQLAKAEGGVDYTDASYIDLGDDFASGAEITFRMDNGQDNRYFPTVHFFAEKADKSFKSAAMNGITFHGDSVGVQYRVYPATDLANAIVYGDTTTFAAYSKLTEIKTHVFDFTVKCIRSDQYYISFTLYDVTDGKEIGSVSKTFALDYQSIKAKEGTGSHIVVYGSRSIIDKGQITITK